MKRKVYFFESNIPLGGTVYLPLVSGILQAYAQTFSEINERCEFMPYIFIRDTPENMIKDVEEPFLMAFSICIWNHQLSLAVAKLVKQRWPSCIIVFGGPQITEADAPYCDYIVKEEGEKKFVSLLAELIGEKIDGNAHNLSHYPSPYVSGLFERYTYDYPGLTFQAIVETNRGCPFTCSFCYWGQGFEEKKVRHHSLEHVKEEAEWIGQNKIKYIFMADANFGMYERDQEVAKIYAKVKETYGYPEKIRVCYGKNKEENVYKTAKILHEAGLAKAVTLAKQSHSNAALEAISRSNIKLNTYNDLALRYHSEGISTYTELILGLPGETLESFKKGVDEVATTPTQLFVYHCTLLPNTPMAEPAYIEKYGIKTVRVPLTEIHGEIRRPEYVVEYEDIIIETSTMTTEEWVDGAVYAWMTQLRCVFGVEFLNAHDRAMTELVFRGIAAGITFGIPRGQVYPKYSNYYLEPEEYMYLMICDERGLITGDPKEFAKTNVLWGRKSRVKPSGARTSERGTGVR